jgi:hypothetical protein
MMMMIIIITTAWTHIHVLHVLDVRVHESDLGQAPLCTACLLYALRLRQLPPAADHSINARRNTTRHMSINTIQCIAYDVYGRVQV